MLISVDAYWENGASNLNKNGCVEFSVYWALKKCAALEVGLKGSFVILEKQKCIFFKQFLRLLFSKLLQRYL